jgi:hypothetical protein
MAGSGGLTMRRAQSSSSTAATSVGPSSVASAVGNSQTAISRYIELVKALSPRASLNLKSVFPASLISFRVIAKVHWIEAQLLSGKNTQCRAAHTATRCALAITTLLPGIN